MRKLVMIAVAATFANVSGASAADLGRAAPVKEDIYTPAPAYSWTGLYIGGNVGYGWADEHQQVQDTASAHMDFAPEGAIAGGQIGYNIQTKGLVLGVEGSGSWSGIEDNTIFTPPPARSEHESITELRGIVDISGRLGVALDRTLLYGKAGVAWGWFDHTYNITRGGETTQFTSDTEVMTGWLVGGGAEFALSKNWTAKVEYNYIDFGTGTFTLANSMIQKTDFDTTVNVVKGGVNYKFGGPQAEPLK